MKTKRGIVAAVLAAAGVLGSACGASPGDTAQANRTCKLADCGQGVYVDFRFRDAGAYVFEVTFEGVKATCTATIPRPHQTSTSCDEPDVRLTVEDSSLNGEQWIGGLQVASTTAPSISMRATRDGIAIGEKTFVPSYVTTPGPNGPECEPKECTTAKVAFP